MVDNVCGMWLDRGMTKGQTMTTTKFAVVDRFGNSAVGLGHCVSVHRTQEAADRELARWDASVRRGMGQSARTGWQVEEVPGDTRKGERARRA